jgi:hypothetical protein
MNRDLELIITRHFIDRFYGLILLPRCHRTFHIGWLTEILDAMESHKFLYYSVLACAASHLYLVDGSMRMQDLGLTYYSSAITKLSTFLNTTSRLENHDGLLMSVMLFTIHGVSCPSPAFYTAVHLPAANSLWLNKGGPMC